MFYNYKDGEQWIDYVSGFGAYKQSGLLADSLIFTQTFREALYENTILLGPRDNLCFDCIFQLRGLKHVCGGGLPNVSQYFCLLHLVKHLKILCFCKTSDL